MFKGYKKIFIGVLFLLVLILIFGKIEIKASTQIWNNYGYNDADLYKLTNTYDYEKITIKETYIDEYGVTNTRDYITQFFDMDEKNGEVVTPNLPILTVFTPGLGSKALDWSSSNNQFTYCEDSLVTRLSNIAIEGVNIYWYVVKNNDLKIYDLGAQNEEIKKGLQTKYKETCEIYRITDITKPIIILFETDKTDKYNNDVYEDFNYAISKAVYDIKFLSNGVLPKINLIGHSRGGITNLQYALDHPELVDSIFSMGTPYLGSTSSMVDFGILESFGANIGGGPGTGEEDIVNDNRYMEYYNRWNDNYERLSYENIKVHAFGGYSTTMFLQHIFTSDYAKEELSFWERSAIISIIELIEDIEFIYNSKKNILSIEWLRRELIKVSEDLIEVLGSKSSPIALADILLNEIRFDWSYPFTSWYNDGLVDLDSQLGQINLNIDVIDLEYKGFNRIPIRFTISNSEINKVAHNNLSIVHNLETRDNKIIKKIVKEISISGKISADYETYSVSGNELGIKTILKNTDEEILTIPSSINGKTVVEIAPSAFSNDFNGNTKVTKVIIPNTVRKIGANAFENCSELRIVEFESNSSLYELGDYAFYNCPLLNSINTPSNVILGECIFLNSNLILDEEYNSEIYSRVNNLGSINCMMEELRGNYYLYKGFSMYFKFSVECEYEYDFNAIADEGIKIWLYDSNLELLFEESTFINDGTNTAIIENLTPGDYYLRITAEDGNYDGSVEVIVDNDIAEKEELLVDTETDVLEHLHNGHNEFFFMRNKTDFYEFWLIAEDSGEVIFPEGAITIFDSNGNIVEKFAIDNLDYSNSADSIYSATSITVLIEEYMNYYIHIDIDANIEYSSLKIVALSLGARNLDSEDNLVETDNKIGDKIDIINVERTGHYDLNITYNGNQEEEILYVILKKDSNNNFTLIDKFLLNSENNAINENYIFNGGEVLYIGYFNYLGNGNIKLEINRIIKQKFDLMIDPNMNVVVGTEVSVNEGSCNETTITQGYTRVCYLGMYAPNLDSRMLYEWSSSDETIAKVSSYGTITATATWTDNATCKKVKIKATYQSNITIVGEIEIEVYKDTRTDEKYLQYGMDVRETSPITGNEVTTGKGYPIPVSTSPTVVIHKSNTRLICLGNDSPSKIIQDFTWTSLDPSVAVVSQYGTITGYHSGETKILGVYKYNPRFKVEIILIVVTI